MTVYPVHTQRPDPDDRGYNPVNVMSRGEATLHRLAILHTAYIGTIGLQTLWTPARLWARVLEVQRTERWNSGPFAMTVLGQPTVLWWSGVCAYPYATILGDTQEDL